MDADNDIRELLRSGNAEALVLIHERYAGILHALILGIVGHSDDADDAMQNLYVTVSRQRARLAGSTHLLRYLATMARNEALQLLRSTRRHRIDRLTPDLIAAGDLPCGGGDQQLISDAIMSLPADQREVVLLKIWHDMTFAAMADLLGISQNTAASRYRYAMDKLRVSLAGLT